MKQLEDQVMVMEHLTQKLECAAKMDKDADSVYSSSALSESARTIHECRRRQLKVNHWVLEGIANSQSDDELTVFSAAWVHQPYLDRDCAAAELLIEQVAEKKN